MGTLLGVHIHVWLLYVYEYKDPMCYFNGWILSYSKLQLDNFGHYSSGKMTSNHSDSQNTHLVPKKNERRHHSYWKIRKRIQ